MVCIVFNSIKPSMNVNVSSCLTRAFVVLLHFNFLKKVSAQNTISYATSHDFVTFSQQFKNLMAIAVHSFSWDLIVLAGQKN